METLFSLPAIIERDTKSVLNLASATEQHKSEGIFISKATDFY